MRYFPRRSRRILRLEFKSNARQMADRILLSIRRDIQAYITSEEAAFRKKNRVEKNRNGLHAPIRVSSRV